MNIYTAEEPSQPSLTSCLYERYPSRAKRLISLFETANNCPCSWANITKVRLQRMAVHAQEVMCRASARTYMAYFKALLNTYSDEIDLPRDYGKVLTLKNELSENVWLTDAEIDRLSRYQPATELERTVLSTFLLSCLTGARHSDAQRFTKGNIREGVLSYVSVKTKTSTQVPLSPLVERIISEGMHEGTVADTVYNDTIRSICYKCHIRDTVKLFRAGKEAEGQKWEFVASHTARRSFATNLYLRCGDIFRISRYMGHSSVDMTANYILSIGDAPAEVKAYFAKFK